jgi:hypothetical protein
MGLTIHDLYTASILQQPERRLRQSALPSKPAGLVENLGRIFSGHADGFVKHESSLEDVGSVASAPPEDKRLTLRINARVLSCQSVRPQAQPRRCWPRPSALLRLSLSLRLLLRVRCAILRVPVARPR